MSVAAAASLSPATDADLVRAARSGDVTSLGVLLERHRASLYGAALQILGHGAAAEDAVHETFLVAVRKLDRVRDPNAVGGWLHAVTRNVCLMELRRHSGESLVADAGLAHTHAGSSGLTSSIEEEVEHLAVRDWVWAALDRLSDPLRLTAMLRYFSRVTSYEDIAAVCGVPVGTVRSRLNQAKLKLSEELLDAAVQADSEARQLLRVRAEEFRHASDEMKRDRTASWVRAMCTRDVVVLYRDHRLDGRENLASLLERDLGIGVDLTMDRVIAGRGMTIMDGRYANPPEDPFHCPPHHTAVYIDSGGGIHTIHAHFSDRVPA
jgi:RNA polymerase sigma factor (sigma-70 family)